MSYIHSTRCPYNKHRLHYEIHGEDRREPISLVGEQALLSQFLDRSPRKTCIGTLRCQNGKITDAPHLVFLPLPHCSTHPFCSCLPGIDSCIQPESPVNKSSTLLPKGQLPSIRETLLWQQKPDVQETLLPALWGKRKVPLSISNRLLVIAVIIYSKECDYARDNFA